MVNRIFKVFCFVYVLGLLFLYFIQKPTLYLTLKKFNQNTVDILQDLVKTKYFRLLRLNLASQCPLPVMNKLCKSRSCAVCRCDEKDIPQNWITTDKVKKGIKEQLDMWSKEREDSSDYWVWHVEDEDNDKGQYFDVHTNVESYSGYNGSYIWSLIYQENCFTGTFRHEQMCLQQKIIYKIISGLHTSISSHLSRLHKNITKTVEWADLQNDKFYFNHNQYQSRVYVHPERIQNLLFIYELLLRSIKQITKYLEQGLVINSDNIAEDLHGHQLLSQLLKQIKKTKFRPWNETDAFFFEPNNPHVRQYQKYIQNISRILNCVQCEKCKLFGKMQTYGLGTALKILLGYNIQFKRNQLVALFNTFNKISISVNTYFNYETKFKDSSQSNENKGKNNYTFEFECDEIWVKLWAFCGLTYCLFLWIATKWNGKQKVKKMFKNSLLKEHGNLVKLD